LFARFAPALRHRASSLCRRRAAAA
jgi:hypothetical protein